MDYMELYISFKVQLDAIDVHKSRLDYDSIRRKVFFGHFTAFDLYRVLRLIERHEVLSCALNSDTDIDRVVKVIDWLAHLILIILPINNVLILQLSQPQRHSV